MNKYEIYISIERQEEHVLIVHATSENNARLEAMFTTATDERFAGKNCFVKEVKKV